MKAKQILKEKLEEKPKNDIIDKELVHELQVHEIELELQNEELRNSQLKLEESRSKYWELYDFAPIGYLTLNDDSLITEINIAGASLLNQPINNLIKQPFILFLTPESRKLFHRHIVNVVNTKIDQECDLKLISTDQQPIDIHIKTSLFNQDGSNNFRIALIDISQTKQAEDLRESEKRFHALADNIPNMVWMGDENGSIFWYNKQWYDYTGTNLDKMRGWGWIKLIQPEYAADVKQEWSRSINDGKLYDNTFPIRSKDGNYRWFLTRITPINDDKGKINCWFGTSTDIMVRKQAESQLELTLKQLRRSNSELEQFTYIASHDLQEPLRMICSFLQLLQRRYEYQLDADADEFIEFAVDGANRMHDLIENLLEFSEVTTEGKKFNNVDMKNVLEETLNNLAISIRENNATITYGKLPVLKADYKQMIQLFENLIGNAIKYRNKNSPQINISARKEDRKWIFSIKDNGIGIDPKYSDRIFKIFKRLHSNNKYEGTGIGLAISKRIVERHGGNMWVDSKSGEGSTFYFTITT